MSHPGLEGELEQREIPTTVPELMRYVESEFREGIKQEPVLAAKVSQFLSYHYHTLNINNTGGWLEYLSMVAIFAPVSIAELLPHYEHRFIRYSPGLYRWFKSGLNQICDLGRGEG